MNLYKQLLLKYWGFSKFRPLQEEIIDSVYSGKNTLALMPTGGGKSITFQIPALAKDGICLVITPLIALMKDQVEGLNKRGIKAMAIYSGMKKREIDLALDNCIFGDYKFLYLSPERINTELFKARVTKMNVNMIAVDEAHCISQWGYDFRPSYLNIAALNDILNKDVPFLALTATATPEVVEDIQDKLRFKEKNVLWKSFERKNLVYLVRKVESKENYLLNTLSKIKGTGIIYTRSRKKTKWISDMLNKHGIVSDYYHAGLSNEVRSEKQDAWQQNKKRVMVATNAFGMGIDKPDVRFVVHYDLPDNLESYYQEAGRAGRDEKKAYAVLLFSDADKAKMKQRVQNSFPEMEDIKNLYEAICQYLQIPYEGGKYQAYDFNISDFASRYKFGLMTIYNGIKLLQRGGYLELTDEVSNRSKIYFIVNRDDLYNFQLANEKYDGFIKLILRNYTGVFTDYTKIDENMLAKKIHVSVDKIYQYLNRLKYYKIIDYIPYKKTPMIVLTEERLKKKSIYLSKDQYKERKELFSKQVKKVLEYAETETKCRSQILLEYFGEDNAYRCGICDVCTRRNELELSKYEFDVILEELKKILKNKATRIDEIIERIEYPKNKILKVIDWLADNRKIIKEGEDRFKWHK
jgi:ATP-dependent DNA helicase RecQ